MPEREPPPFDQAAGLRRLFDVRRRPPRLIPLVTPEGGGDQVGFVIDLAAALARQGQRTLLLDGEHGRIAPMLGLKARYDLSHVLSGERPAAAVTLATDGGFSVMPAARALRAAASRRPAAAELERWLGRPDADFEIVLASATLTTAAPLMIGTSAEIFLACGAEPWQLARIYARIKLLHDHYPGRRFRVAYYPAESLEQAAAAHLRLARATRLYLGFEAGFGGAVADDPAVHRARTRGTSVFAIAAGGAAARALDQIASTLCCCPGESRADAPRPEAAAAGGPPDADAPAALVPVGLPPGGWRSLPRVVDTADHVYRPRHA
jgi:flagellar biosynthesis protein FlhG